jgi:CubicO group peptidase (beta-lactamase class C family)
MNTSSPLSRPDGYGFRSDRQRLGSITKQLTATAILQLQARGELAIFDPVSRYIPESPAAWKDIGIRRLLTNTSGSHNYYARPSAGAFQRPAARFPARQQVQL